MCDIELSSVSFVASVEPIVPPRARSGASLRAWAAALGVLIAGGACRCTDRVSFEPQRPTRSPVTSSPGFNPILLKGPEVWTIDGRNVHIRATYFLVVKGRLQFTVDYLCEEECHRVPLECADARIRSVAYSVMNHVLANRIHERGQVQELAGKRLDVEVIGVAITQQLEGRERGCRVSGTLDEIRGVGTSASKPVR